jgi:thioredoxin 1
MKILYKSAKYFSATWCGPCKAFKPVMQEIASDGYFVEFIDVDKEENKAQHYGIRSVPTVVIEQGGQEVSRFTGALSKQLVLERLA